MQHSPQPTGELARFICTSSPKRTKCACREVIHDIVQKLDQHSSLVLQVRSWQADAASLTVAVAGQGIALTHSRRHPAEP
jgi:hypothetical protein